MYITCKLCALDSHFPHVYFIDTAPKAHRPVLLSPS